MIDKKRISEIIEEKKNIFIEVNDKIWEYAETRFEEYKSADLLCKVLKNEGFNVERDIADITTAFLGSYGSGKPVVAILGEYDALSGISQKCGISNKESLIDGGNGHGCGHNILGAGALAAAVAVKNYMEENNVKGTIRYYGCPGEEGGSGKAFMARNGIFDDVDIALTWHPMSNNAIFSTSSLANYQIYFKFHGRSAHAAACPHLGRSALDAVELMNIGANYLREHIIPEARVHYAVTNTGGSSPNVVQPEAEVLYLIRAPKLAQVQEIYERVCKIAKGAAMMTETECEILFDKACSNLIPNHTLEKILYENFKEVGAPVFNEEERKFAKKIRTTLSDSDKENEIKMAVSLMGKEDREILKKLKQKDLSDILLPYKHFTMTLAGSTDVGDVSWVTPTAQIITACSAFGTPAHSWQTVAQGATSIAHKGMITAGKVIAMTAIDVLENPEIAEKAKEELREKLDGDTYNCPIPKGVKPSAIK
ncbi:M20 family metallopeptidase [Crassaminicella profunda]|uniref:M20 family metallopeptidase n=1 Tax=Crassaminicella profunda TaxID=1286698 RepID=UPI001CA5F5F7|nr:M20 family metallopeptidase [Crassaminicella profunda]QZY56161.1 amidohydrolase [Crassaminicella profunda]